MMKAILMPGDRRIDIVERQTPDVGTGEVLLEMKAAGLCGSDLHMQFQPPHEQRYGSFYGLKTDPDIVPGHEAAGVVVEVGPGVIGLKVGDRVAVHHMGGCGHCEQCRRGWDINCPNKWGIYGLNVPGAMQDYMVVRARDCVIVPDEISLSEACYYSCGAGTGFLALRRGDFGLGDTVAVVGLGPVGLAAGYFAARSGAVVVGYDTQNARNEFAMSLGFSAAINPLHDDDGVLQEVTRGRGADVVVEATGKTAGRETALDAAALFGRVVCVGFTDEISSVHLQRGVLQKQVDVRGSWMFPIHELERMMNSMALQGTSIEPLIASTYSLDQGQEAWNAFDKGALGKTVIAW
ncbi:zinc-binding dehydrogenase [Microbacterium pseudoresistens]|uniref:L-iditol 2-dehydrogenase n=1 Tax=Microbacterium pseudoresistens TaxID=640634 RepID=A0A7Y9EUI4_9MICO|nr:alcohol dehydrogenase catalytic domain-containing protein [Microbacterium pseudoresistens]NYD54212.1 L-iditol 2-dehydrogenase [Microbacterium pseudoresistens]